MAAAVSGATSPEKSPKVEEKAYEPAVFIVKTPNFSTEETYVTCNTKAPIQEFIDAFCESTRIPVDELLFSEPLTGTSLSPSAKLGSIGGRTIFVKYLGPQDKSLSSLSSGPESSLRTTFHLHLSYFSLYNSLCDLGVKMGSAWDECTVYYNQTEFWRRRQLTANKRQVDSMVTYMRLSF